MRFLPLLFIVACGGSDTPTTTPTTTNAPARGRATSGQAADNPLPIAQYLGSDDATGRRVSELLRAAGIESSAGGSLGYSVWVSGASRAKARRILQDAVAHECLAVSIFDDNGQAIANPPSANCASPSSPAPSSSSK